MASLNIVLVEPEIPQNTGNVARTCAATGARLHLVGPMGFTIDDKKLKRAGLDYWHLLDITYYDSLASFLEKTAGRSIIFQQRLQTVTVISAIQKAPISYSARRPRDYRNRFYTKTRKVVYACRCEKACAA